MLESQNRIQDDIQESEQGQVQGQDNRGTYFKDKEEEVHFRGPTSQTYEKEQVLAAGSH